MSAFNYSLDLVEYRVVTGGPRPIALRLEIEAEGAGTFVQLVWRRKAVTGAKHQVRPDQRAGATGHVERRWIGMAGLYHHNNADASRDIPSHIARRSACHVFPVRGGPAQSARLDQRVHIRRREQENVRVRSIVSRRESSGAGFDFFRAPVTAEDNFAAGTAVGDVPDGDRSAARQVHRARPEIRPVGSGEDISVVA